MGNAEIHWRSDCPVCAALDVLGDKWTMLIIRDLIMHGPRTYSELLESPEHISTNILANRLNLLGALKLIERENPQHAARNNPYKLTESGVALQPVLEGLARWAQIYLKHFHDKRLSMQPEKDER